MLHNQSQLFPLKININSKKHIVQRIGYPYEAFEYFRNNKEVNVNKLILKQLKNGKIKERVVYNPSNEYKKLLRAINRELLQRTKLPEGILGGVIGKSIIDMAKVHSGREAVLLMDCKNFFPSITSGRVVNLFRNANCSPEIAGLLTDLVTLNDSLPQGFPTSPMLANLIAFGLDIQHIEQGRKYNLNRIRWLDDIVFSGRAKDLTISIKPLLGAIKPHGFQLNNKKTEYKVRNNRPIVCGLDVSRKVPHVPVVVIDKVREILYDCKHSGITAVQTAYESDSFGRKKDLKSSLNGRIQNIERYNAVEGKELKDIFNSISWNC